MVRFILNRTLIENCVPIFGTMAPEGRIHQKSAKNDGPVFVNQFNPITGKSEWVAQPADYDFAMEIARSAYADMLHDHDRNVKFTGALSRVVSQLMQRQPSGSVHVLDIGTGSGLLAMAAKKLARAHRVWKPPYVYNKNPRHLLAGPPDDRADICIAEVFDTELIGEGAIHTFKEAHATLLKPNARVIPARARVFALPVESEFIADFHKLQPIRTDNCPIVMPPEVENCGGAASVVHDLQLSTLPENSFTPLCEPVCIYEFDFERPDTLFYNGSRTITVAPNESTHARRVDGIFMWWDLDMDGSGDPEMLLTMAPRWSHVNADGHYHWRDHWMQAVYYLPRTVIISPSDALELTAYHDEYSWWFDGHAVKKSDPQIISATTNAETERQAAPLCTCGLHMAASRASLARINDSAETRVYVQHVGQLMSPSKSVLCLSGDPCGVPSLALHACALGACSVVQILDGQLSRQAVRVANDFVRVNRDMVGDRLTLCSSELPVGFEPDIVIIEPVFAGGALPWHELRLWYELERLVPDRKMKGVALLPCRGRLMCCALALEHLWKIRAPVGTVLGFDLSPFDQVVQTCIATADSSVEPHHIWEYEMQLVSDVQQVAAFDFAEKPTSCAVQLQIELLRTGCNALAFWMEYDFPPTPSSETRISRGLLHVSDADAKLKPKWCRHSRQGVYFLPHSDRLSCLDGSVKGLSLSWSFDSETGTVNCGVVL